MMSDKVRALRCSDEDWNMIKDIAKNRKQTVGDFIVSAVKNDSENTPQQDVHQQLITHIARGVYLCVASVVEKKSNEWIDEKISDAKKKYPHVS